MESIPEINPGNERVQDINKAREMAYAEKPYRDEIEQKTETIDKKYAVNPDYELQGESLLEIAELNAKANAAAKRTGIQYELTQKLQNNEELNEEEKEHLKTIGEQYWADDSYNKPPRILEELRLYQTGGLTRREIEENYRISKDPGIYNTEHYKHNIEPRKGKSTYKEKQEYELMWELFREGNNKEQVAKELQKREHKKERYKALTNITHPLHRDMRRAYENIKKSQSEKVKQLRENLKTKQKELKKYEEANIFGENAMKMYTYEVESICAKLDACEEYAREEAYKIAKLHERIDSEQKKLTQEIIRNRIDDLKERLAK